MKTKVYPCNYTDDLEKKCSSEASAVGIEEMSITYVQPADTCSNQDEIQNLTITTRCGDSVGIGEEGYYFDITIPAGEHWSIEDGEELKALVDDFKSRLYNKQKEQQS